LPFKYLIKKLIKYSNIKSFSEFVHSSLEISIKLTISAVTNRRLK